MAFAPTKRTKDLLLWMLSTKMMPAVGVLVPIYLIFIALGLLDTHIGIIVLLCLGNLPIVIWMLFTYFKEIPKDILEAARMDGATTLEGDRLRADADGGARHRLDRAPQRHPRLERGVLDAEPHDLDAAPLTAFIASFSAPQGLFWAKLSAASTLAIAPILVLGWFSQRQLVRGLTFGAVK